jgi:sortase A
VKPFSGLLVGVGFAMAGAGVATWGWSVGAQQFAEQSWEAWESQAASTAEVDPLYSSLVLLSYPRLNERVFVLEGANPRNLARGPAIVESAVAPGDKGNCVIAGHRDTHFRFLKDVRLGDELHLERGRNSYRYRVTSTHIVDPTNLALLRPESKAVLTLVTCYPFHYVGRAPQRFIVRAELVDLSAG